MVAAGKEVEGAREAVDLGRDAVLWIYDFLTIKLVVIGGAVISFLVVFQKWGPGLRNAATGFYKFMTTPQRLEATLNNQVLPAIKNLQYEMAPNGGSSLRDRVDQINHAMSILNGRSIHTIKAIDQPIFEMSPSGDIIFANPAYVGLMNARFDEVVGKGWLSRVSESDRLHVWNTWDYCLKNKLPLEVSFVLDNGRMALRATKHAHPYMSPKGEIIGYIGYVKLQEHRQQQHLYPEGEPDPSPGPKDAERRGNGSGLQGGPRDREGVRGGDSPTSDGSSGS